MLQYGILYSLESTQEHNRVERIHTRDSVRQTCELTYARGLTNTRSRLWKLTTWRFVRRGLTVCGIIGRTVAWSDAEIIQGIWQILNIPEFLPKVWNISSCPFKFSALPTPHQEPWHNLGTIILKIKLNNICITCIICDSLSITNPNRKRQRMLQANIRRENPNASTSLN